METDSANGTGRAAVSERLVDLVFDAWLEVQARDCEAIKRVDPRLRALTDRELLDIIAGW